MKLASVPGSEPSRFGFLLLNDFTLISLSAAIEPLRMANRIVENEHYRWKTISETGAAVVASDGLSVNVDHGTRDAGALHDIDILMVCSGVRVQANYGQVITRFLRRASRKGISLGAICTGTHVLAAAGLLDGYRCSIHWQNLGAFTNAFPQVNVRRSLFTIDRSRYTCSGGTAPIDLMLHLIGKQLGATVSVAVAEQFICDRIRRGDDDQRVPLRHLVGHQSAKLTATVELMEANLREPIGQEELATYVGLSRRQLQRLFRKYLSRAPSQYYLGLRLNRARDLMRQTGMSILEIAGDCGFVSASHFSKSFKEHFGYSPSVERRRHSPPAG